MKYVIVGGGHRFIISPCISNNGYEVDIIERDHTRWFMEFTWKEGKYFSENSHECWDIQI